MSKWIEFIEKEIPGNRKTKSWFIQNTQSKTVIGWIHWHTGFRKYSFYPEDNMVFDAGCLESIAGFCRDKTIVHYSNLKT